MTPPFIIYDVLKHNARRLLLCYYGIRLLDSCNVYTREHVRACKRRIMLIVIRHAASILHE